MRKATYVTTSIPYVNARPHIGFALELVQADVVARYSRLLDRTTRFQTGTDENAFKNVLSARDEGISPQELVERNSSLFQDLCTALNISADSFLRTTDERHQNAVHHFWRKLKKEDIYLNKYKGLYCIGCEDFYLERELVNGRCPDHDTEPVQVDEENYFFRLSSYQEQLRKLLETDRVRVVPRSRKNEVLSFISRGLQDISISRSYERSGGWGIQVPGDPSQVVYVWIDALINYVSGLGFGARSDWDSFWDSETLKVHVIGKNVWKFHAVYWPALLISAGLPLPDEIVVHGFLTENGQKISKSKGNTINPFACISDYGADTVRYYLLRAVSPFGDGDFSTGRLKSLHNSDLANGLGNLVSRLTTLCHRSDYGDYDDSEVPTAPEGYDEALHNYEFDKALKTLWTVVTHLNRDIDRREPWKALKDGSFPALKTQLTEWLGDLHMVGYWLAPFLPATSEKITSLLSTHPIRVAVPLFPRVV